MHLPKLLNDDIEMVQPFSANAHIWLVLREEKLHIWPISAQMTCCFRVAVNIHGAELLGLGSMPQKCITCASAGSLARPQAHIVVSLERVPSAA